MLSSNFFPVAVNTLCGQHLTEYLANEPQRLLEHFPTGTKSLGALGAKKKLEQTADDGRMSENMKLFFLVCCAK